MIHHLGTTIVKSNYELKVHTMKLGKYSKNKIAIKSCVVATLY